MADCPTTGLWADLAVPHSGWEVLDSEVDPETAPFMRCQMCGRDDAGDLEHYQHQRYGRYLVAGSCCGRHMEVGPGPDWTPPPQKIPEPDYEADRSTWDERTWAVRENGSVYMYVYDFVVSIDFLFGDSMSTDGACRITITHVAEDGTRTVGKTVYPNLAEAKRNAFNALMWGIKNRRPRYPVPPEGWPKYFAIAYDRPFNFHLIEKARSYVHPSYAAMLARNRRRRKSR